MKILLAEDNSKTRQVIISLLNHNLHGLGTIYECEDGQKAVELYKKFQPGWVLMDINLKNIDGLTAAREILRFDAAAKIIIVTLYDDPEYRDAARKAGAYGYVLKENLYEMIKLMTPAKKDSGAKS